MHNSLHIDVIPLRWVAVCVWSSRSTTSPIPNSLIRSIKQFTQSSPPEAVPAFPRSVRTRPFSQNVEEDLNMGFQLTDYHTVWSALCNFHHRLFLIVAKRNDTFCPASPPRRPTSEGIILNIFDALYNMWCCVLMAVRRRSSVCY